MESSWTNLCVKALLDENIVAKNKTGDSKFNYSYIFAVFHYRSVKIWLIEKIYFPWSPKIHMLAHVLNIIHPFIY